MEKDFTDINSYNKNMAKPMDDKLFFLEKLDWDDNIIVDFGCADGRVLAEIKNRLETMYLGKRNRFFYIGYDISPVMIDFAKTNWDGDGRQVLFTSNWNDVIKAIEDHNEMKPVLFLSSVIHEVYSYAKNEEEITEFWGRVLNTGFKYVVVRDMMVDKSVNRLNGYDIPYQLKNTFTLDCYRYEPYLKEFEARWGKITKNKNAVHFLLKYPWTINWERENNENYLPLYTNDLVRIMIQRYDIEYFKHYILQFVYDRVLHDWGLHLKDNTHVKAIFKFRE